MVTVSEVVVRAVPEGISETTDGLEEVESATKETTDQMSEQSEEMSSFAQSFQGSMSAILAGLGVATAGLLSQVPVIGEAFSGLTAVVDAVALRLDSVLRPVFSPITNGLMRLADIVATADGAFGLFLDSIIVIGTTLGTIAGIIATVSTLASAFAGTFSTLATVGSVVVGVLTTIVSIIGIVPLVIAAVVVGVALLIEHFIGFRNIWNGLVDRIQAGIGILRTLVDIFTTVAPAVLDKMAAGIKEGISNAIGAIVDFVSDVADKFDGLVSDAKEWGSDLLEGFIAGIGNKIEDVKEKVNEFADAVRDRMPSSNAETGPLSDLKESGQALPQTFAEGISANSGVSLGATEDALNGADDFIGSVGGGASKVYLDGQRVDNNQGRFRKDSLTRRGG